MQLIRRNDYVASDGDVERRPCAGLAVLFAATACIVSARLEAEPTVSNVTITSVRIYSNGANSSGLIQVTGVPGTFCSGATNYVISLADIGGQGMLAAAMAAVTSGNSVSLEISNSSGCTVEQGWGPQLQSLYLNNHP